MPNNDELPATITKPEVLERIRKIVLDEVGSDSIDKLFFEFLENKYELNELLLMFFEHPRNSSYDVVLEQYFTFIDVLDWYNTMCAEG